MARPRAGTRRPASRWGPSRRRRGGWPPGRPRPMTRTACHSSSSTNWPPGSSRSTGAECPGRRDAGPARPRPRRRQHSRHRHAAHWPRSRRRSGSRRRGDTRPISARTWPGTESCAVDYDAALSLHPVVTNNPAEHRLQRLATPRSSTTDLYGCINVPAQFTRRSSSRSSPRPTASSTFCPRPARWTACCTPPAEPGRAIARAAAGRSGGGGKFGRGSIASRAGRRPRRSSPRKPA